MRTATLRTMAVAAVVETAVFVSGPAAAQQICGPRAEMLAKLSQYAESPVAVGLDRAGRLLEVLATPTGSTWTIIVTSANGTSCLVMNGESWQPRETPPGKMGQES